MILFTTFLPKATYDSVVVSFSSAVIGGRNCVYCLWIIGPTFSRRYLYCPSSILSMERNSNSSFSCLSHATEQEITSFVSLFLLGKLPLHLIFNMWSFLAYLDSLLDRFDILHFDKCTWALRFIAPPPLTCTCQRFRLLTYVFFHMISYLFIYLSIYWHPEEAQNLRDETSYMNLMPKYFTNEVFRSWLQGFHLLHTTLYYFYLFIILHPVLPFFYFHIRSPEAYISLTYHRYLALQLVHGVRGIQVSVQDPRTGPDSWCFHRPFSSIDVFIVIPQSIIT